MLRGEHLAVLDRHYLDEFLGVFLPARQNAPRELAFGEIVMSAHEVVDGLHVGIVERIEPDHSLVAVTLEVTVSIEDVGDAAAHPGREITSGLAENDDEALGHV